MLDRLRKGPFLRSAPELVRDLRRIGDVRGLGINLSASSRVAYPSSGFARFAAMAGHEASFIIEGEIRRLWWKHR